MTNPTPSKTEAETIIRVTFGQRFVSVCDFFRGIIYPKDVVSAQGTTARRISKREQAALVQHRSAWLGQRAPGLEKTVASYSY